ncbi:MAG: ABC transporter permease [Pirellulales bacterium]
MQEQTPVESKNTTSSMLSKALEIVGPILALLVVFFLFVLLDQMFGNQSFMSIAKCRMILVQTAVVAVAALGMTLIIVSGGIDLSAGTALALCATVLAWGLREDVAFLASQGQTFESASTQLQEDQLAYRKIEATTKDDPQLVSTSLAKYENSKDNLIAMLEIKVAQVSQLPDSEKNKEHLEILESKNELLLDPDHLFFANKEWLKKIPNSPWSIWIALCMSLVTGVVTGVINGSIITSLRVVPFIVTLGTMTIYKGVGLYLANDTPVRPNIEMQVPNQFSLLIGTQSEALIMGLPIGLWLLVLMAIAVSLFLRYSVLSRHIFAVGSNESTARLCGINVPGTKILVYAISGLFVGIAGIYFFSRLSIGNPSGGSGMELEIIAAVVIGGGSLSGGRGSVLGTIAGALIVGVISAGASHLDWKISVYNIILGCVIIGAVLVDQIRQRYHESN